MIYMVNQIGKEIRLSHILRRNGKGVVVTFDHGLPVGPMQGIIDLNETIGKMASAKPDGLLLTPGQAGVCRRHLLGLDSPALLVRVDWTTQFRESQKGSEGYGIICSPLDALRLGAEGIVTYLFSGYKDSSIEALNIQEVGRISRECDQLGLPLIVEAMALGDLVRERQLDPDLMKIPIRAAGEIGADLVKASYPGNADSFREIVRCSPVPVMIAGGPKMKTIHDALQTVRDAMDAGAIGVFFGRNVFQSANPLKTLKTFQLLVHEGASVEEAERVLRETG